MKERNLNSSDSNKIFLFSGKNHKLMLVGTALIFIGFLLMTGGGSDDPDFFDQGMFSFRRIRLAPIVILIGFIVEVYAILSQNKSTNE